ncbi:alpha/beta hydrolase [Streptomyces montanisoli]|uniref:Alpha/beta hydrolase n=1 Tax=Streptomyces montanisoli TaxID=2798581 RepID=A0A940S139_9ACTN|nr:alpha/beta hydrolase [Streptomyces montanisoli]MBP0461559.1 alpha/beta hydrolase [Streptomyces montanisoli]
MPDAVAHGPVDDCRSGGTREAGRDTGRDAGRDAGRGDAGRGDAGRRDADRRDAGRDEAEHDSLFSHAAVAPDVTAAYGEHPDQVVDFYAPRADGAASAPLVVLLHGGAYRERVDRTHLSPFAGFLARRGFAVAGVEYRRGPGVPHEGDGTPPAGDGPPPAGRWPETFEDVAAALDALPALAREALPRADPRRTVLAGHSAGGQLALWAAARHVLPQGSPWRLAAAPPLRGVVALGALADLGLAAELAVCHGAVNQLLGEGEEFKQRQEIVDPALLLPTGIATTVVQGREDTTVPYVIAESFVDAASRAGETVGLTLLEGVGHFPPVDPAADACAVAAEEIAQLAW